LGGFLGSPTWVTFLFANVFASDLDFPTQAPFPIFRFVCSLPFVHTFRTLPEPQKPPSFLLVQCFVLSEVVFSQLEMGGVGLVFFASQLAAFCFSPPVFLSKFGRPLVCDFMKQLVRGVFFAYFSFFPISLQTICVLTRFPHPQVELFFFFFGTVLVF